MDPCVYCGDTDGDCACSLPGIQGALSRGEFEYNRGGIKMCDSDEHAEYLDGIYVRLEDEITKLLKCIGFADFKIAMQVIIKRVLKQRIEEVNKDA